MQTADKASSIVIRGIQLKDREILKALRWLFNTKFNAHAVMRASQDYVNKLKQIETLTTNIKELERVNSELLGKYINLQLKVKHYFEIENSREKFKSIILEDLSKTDPEIEK